jgi:hypothetical protein
MRETSSNPVSSSAAWQEIRLPVFPEQQSTLYGMAPVWEFHAIYDEPDGEVSRPASYLADAGVLEWHFRTYGRGGNLPFTRAARDKLERTWWYFGARHLDARFSIENLIEEKEAPRPVSQTYGERERDWDVVMSFRDKILEREGLSAQSDRTQIAYAIAYEIYQNWRGGGTRNHPADVLTHRSWCLGAENTTCVILRSLGIPARGARCSGHAMCEFFVDGAWQLLDSSNNFINHEPKSTVMIPSSYMELTTNPTASRHGSAMSDYHKGFFYHWPNGHYGIPDGRWEQDSLLYYCPAYAKALYAGAVNYRFKTDDPQRLVILERDIRQLYRSELGIYLNPGERLRESVYLGDLDDVKHFEFILRFAPCDLRYPTEESTKELMLRVGDTIKPLQSCAAWPSVPHWDHTVLLTVRLEKDLFQPNAVNWLCLENQSRQRIVRIPVTRAVAEPYIAPLQRG